jgi:YVTN family beta-propeller protein
MRILALGLLLSTALALPAAAATAEKKVLPVVRAPGPYAYVQTNRAVDIISLDKLEKVGSIPIADDPDSVASDPAGRVVYVNAVIDMGHPQGRSHLGKVMAYSTLTEELLWTAALDGEPDHLDVSADGKKIFQPLWDRYYSVVLDAQSGKITDRWWGYVGFHDMRGAKDNKRAYAANSATGGFYIYDSNTGEQLAVYNSVRGGIRPMTFNEDESLMYYQVSKYHGFDVMDMKTGKVVNTVQLPPVPPGTRIPQRYPFVYGHGMDMSPDYKYLIAVATMANYIAVYSHPDLKLITTVPTGIDPRWVRISRDGKYAIVTNAGEDTVSIYDTKAWKEIKKIPTNDHPHHMTLIDVPADTTR